MATPNDEATYSLDPETVGVLERVARRWGVSKSEAIRRAIRDSDAGPVGAVEEQSASSAPIAPAQSVVGPDPRIAALRRLQALLNLDKAKADAWMAEVRAERDANL